MILRTIQIWAENGLRYEEAEASCGKRRSGSALLTCFVKENTDGRPNAKRKAVIICPGGCYEFCSTREAEPVAFQFLAMDCQAFVLHYSTAPSVFPTALRELAAAVALIRGNAEEWHIDGERILVCGFSAGGHLAASLGVFWEREFVSGPLGLEPAAVRPSGLILAYPVISSGPCGHEASFDNLTGEAKGGGETPDGGGMRDREELPDGGGTKDGEELPDEAGNDSLREFLSLERQAGPQVPPVFLWHTDTDATVSVENALLFAMALKRAGVSLELHIFPTGRHGLALASEETAKEIDDGRGSYIVPCCQIWTKLAGQWLSRVFIDFPEIS